MRRRGIGRARPSLIGTAARTAVVAGTASRVAGASAQKQAAQAEMAAKAKAHDAAVQQAQIHEAVQQATGSQAPAAGMLDQLKELAALKEQGLLSDDEFTAAKAKLLG